MDFKRAKQILESPDIIEVTYKGSSVWIEEVNQTSAVVSSNQYEDQRVPLELLDEVSM